MKNYLFVSSAIIALAIFIVVLAIWLGGPGAAPTMPSSNSMYPMAQALAAAGVHVFALDNRGHGASGTKGHLGYIG